MAKEYIEREALLDEINLAPVSMSICMNVDECKGRIYERERLMRIINAIPAADVVPVRHGRWNRDKDGLVWCCLCGFGQERSEDRPYAYCPNCGARMEKDGDGDV